MYLRASSEQLARVEEILRQLDDVPTDEALINRRRASRFQLHTCIPATMLTHGQNPLKLFTRNISTAGLGFVCRRFCRIGERLALFFQLPGGQPKLVLAHITFSRYVRAGLYEAGAEFIVCTPGSEERDIPRDWFHRGDVSSADAAKKESNKEKSKSPKPAPEAAKATSASR